MPDYEKLYTGLFNAMTGAIACIDRMDFGAARAILVRAQINAEEVYISAGEESTSREGELPDSDKI